MKPVVRTQQVMEYGARHGGVDDLSGLAADLFCLSCGTPTVIQIERGYGYDRLTGKPKHEAYGVCPRRPTLMGRFSTHTRERIRLDQDEMNQLLYDFVLDATLPNG